MHKVYSWRNIWNNTITSYTRDFRRYLASHSTNMDGMDKSIYLLNPPSLNIPHHCNEDIYSYYWQHHTNNIELHLKHSHCPMADLVLISLMLWNNGTTHFRKCNGSHDLFDTSLAYPVHLIISPAQPNFKHIVYGHSALTCSILK